MKELAKILVGGFAVFMILAIGQRWDYFSSSWFGTGEPAAVLSDADRSAAADAVRAVLSSSSHLLASGGDERFADRLDAGEEVRGEILADAAYLRRNLLRQVSTLVRFEVLDLELVAPRRAELRSREYWVHRLLARDEDRQVEPPISQIVLGTYVVGEQDGRWRVLAWNFAGPDDLTPAADAPAAETPVAPQAPVGQDEPAAESGETPS